MCTHPHARTSAPLRAPLRWPLAAAFALVACLVMPSASVGAQPSRTSLTTSGLPLAVVSTTGADFDAGFVLLGSSTFTVEGTGRTKDFPRTTTVQIGCGVPCPATGTAALNALQWRRDDQVTWTTVGTGFTTIEARAMLADGTDNTWGRTLFWRYVLDWTTTPPATDTQFLIDFQLVVTSP